MPDAAFILARFSDCLCLGRMHFPEIFALKLLPGY